MMWVVVALLALAEPSNATVERAVAATICAEAGHGRFSEADRSRGLLVAHVLNNRARDARFARSPSHRQRLLDVVEAPRQWSRACPVTYDKAPGWLHALAQRLVRGRMHITPPPAWLGRDVLWVVAEAESRRLGQQWGKRRLVKVVWGLAFYR